MAKSKKFTPVTRDDVSDLAGLPQAFRMFVATYNADREWTKEMLTAIRAELDSLRRLSDRHESDIRQLYRAVDDHTKRIERLEQGAGKKGTE